MKRRRVSQQQRDREFQRQVAEQKARREFEEERAAFGAFIMEADEHRLALIERFGVTALRGQLAENREAYRKETREWQRRHVRETLALALKCAQKGPAPSCRVVLYSEERQGWEAKRARYEKCLPGERVRPANRRRKQALAELAKLGIAVEYVNPNAAGDGT